MKRILVILFGAATTLVCSKTAFAHTHRHTTKPCYIHPQDQNKQLTLGNVSTADFRRQGMTAGRKDFSITLSGCPAAYIDNEAGEKKSLVSLGFTGEIGPDGRLKNIRQSNNASRNISIQIRHQERVIDLNNGSGLTANLSNSDEIKLEMSAEYFADRMPVYAGDFFSHVTFKINYK